MFVKLHSHRQREKAERSLGRKLRSFYAPFGTKIGEPYAYEIADSELEVIRKVGGTKAKEQSADFWHPCITWCVLLLACLLSGCQTTARYAVEYRADAARPAEGVIVAGVSGEILRR